MADMKLEALIQGIETYYPTWNWLIRTDATEGYFANIYNEGSTVVNPFWAKTAVDALYGSMLMVEEYEKNSAVPRKPAKYMFERKDHLCLDKFFPTPKP